MQPNWTDSRYLFGYLNAVNGQWVAEPPLDFVLGAAQHPHQLHYLCLDEMNLARVEYSFAHILSALEEDDPAHRVVRLYSPRVGGPYTGTNDHRIPSQFTLAPNLHFVGTINVDDTTQQLKR